jgi:hypothetical protein
MPTKRPVFAPRSLLQICCGLILGASVAYAQPVAKAPCADKQNPPYGQLDFWIGEWSVYKGETKVSDTRIESPEGSCVFTETWVSATPSRSGKPAVSKALLSYDPDTKKWEYFWASASGRHMHFTADPDEHELLWVREQTPPGGPVKTEHLTFSQLPGGTLRELSVVSADGGKTWVTQYDMTWRRKP